jgi:hypothetical protein
MTDEIVTAQTPSAPPAPADVATNAAMEAQITGASPEKAAPLFDKAAVLHRRAEAAQATGDDTWRDGTDAAPLSPMPDAPTIAPTEVSSAIERLNERSGGHSDLVARWGDDFAPNFAYAKSAFADIAANRPDLIAKFERSGLGDDPSVIEHLAQFGRQNAGRLGDFTIARNHNNNGPAPMPTFTPSSPSSNSANSNSTNNNGALETKGELNRLLAANPPGSQGYKTNAARIQQLYGMLSGTGSVVGKGGRRV